MYSHFDRSTVESVMVRLKVPRETLSGLKRSKYPARILDFETFETLSDPVDYFATAMNVELEHGSAAGVVGANVTGDDALTTGKIVVAHLLGVESGDTPPYKPFPTYYDFLLWMEKLHSTFLDIHRLI